MCKSCWQTTEAFHELYEKSKTVRIKFQNSVIKIETEEDELWQSNLETHFIDESQIELGSIKEESAEGKCFSYRILIYHNNILFSSA